jgi:predicted transcriptional regulator
MPEEIRVLAVGQPYANSIIDGLKTIEVRSRTTNIKERVAIYASTNLPSQKEFIEIRQYLALRFLDNPKYDPTEELPIGMIIGTVEIVASSWCNDDLEYDLYKNEHLASSKYYKERKTHFWHLRRPVKFSNPIPYKPPKGAVVWSKTVLPEGY